MYEACVRAAKAARFLAVRALPLRVRGWVGWGVLGAAALLVGCAAPSSLPSSQLALPSVPLLPEGPSGLTAKPGWSAQRFMVAAANPLATDAGYQVLKAGGSALDAAIAVQMVLTLVEPQSSGIGGGAFLMHWDGRTVQAWDGRETAPASADERLFLLPDGKPMPFPQAVVGGRSVGVPGVVRMLEQAHRAHGKLPWPRLFEPAIRLAEQGFSVSPRLNTQLLAEQALKATPNAAAYFFGPDGQPHPVGHRLRNPALAQVLKRVAAEGSAALHTGPLAEDMVRRVRQHPANPGLLSMADLTGYRPVVREPICTDWRAYRICGFPPPSSGHLAVMQILGMLDALGTEAPGVGAGVAAGAGGAGGAGVTGVAGGAKGADGLVAANGPSSPPFLHRYTEAARLAFADRAQYVADPDFIRAPGGNWSALLDPSYLRQRASLIGAQSMKTAQPGLPPGVERVSHAPQPHQPEFGTSHLSIVDGEGRALAMTTTIEAAWGSRILSDGGTGLPGGFLLNNQLTDFSFAPVDAQGRSIANRVEPGKRPRSSMSPTLVFDRRDGRLLMSLGSPGGAAIIHFTAKTLLGTLAFGLDAQRAIDLPNFGSFNCPTVLEKGRFDAATVEALKARGHAVQEIDMTSGLQAIQRQGGGWFGGADPRREGVVRGD
jgi:gamma-glutamyltranspeptidase/glutathione hydrolase